MIDWDRYRATPDEITTAEGLRDAADHLACYLTDLIKGQCGDDQEAINAIAALGRTLADRIDEWADPHGPAAVEWEYRLVCRYPGQEEWSESFPATSDPATVDEYRGIVARMNAVPNRTMERALQRRRIAEWEPVQP